MEKVGVRELKNKLSKYLKYVKNGKSLIITERNKSIALLEPIRNDLLKDAYLMVSEGSAAWNGEKPYGSSNPLKMKEGEMVSDKISEDRR